MVRHHSASDILLCVKAFGNYLADKEFPPLNKTELRSVYVQLRQIASDIKWTSLGTVMHSISDSEATENSPEFATNHFLCEVCSRVFGSMTLFFGHLWTREHRIQSEEILEVIIAKGATSSNMWTCPLSGCHEQFATQAKLYAHIWKKSHRLFYATTGIPTGYACLDCGQKFPTRKRLSSHINTCDRYEQEAPASNRNFVGDNAGALTLSHEVVAPLVITKNDTDLIEVTRVRSDTDIELVACIPLRLRNNTRGVVHIRSCTFSSNLRTYILQNEVEVGGKHHRLSGQCSVPLSPGQSLQLNLKASRLDSYGYYVGHLHTAFLKEDTEVILNLSVSINLAVSSENSAQLQPTTPYQPRKPLPQIKNTTLLDGDPLYRTLNNQLPFKIPLKSYEVPKYLSNVNPRTPNKCGADQPLTKQCYKKKFSALLHIEEVQMKKDIRKYTLMGASMEKKGPYFYLEVPGLTEKRPSVLPGDYVLVAVLNADGEPDTMTSFRGFVHHVELTTVKLRFHNNLNERYIKGMKFIVEFNFNRLPLKLQHRALEMVTGDDLNDVLFPQQSGLRNAKVDTDLKASPLTSKCNALKFKNRLIESNAEQQKAVQAILTNRSCPAPYLIFGPPGTGKTVTMVEAMTQVYLLDKKNRILACAPQNDAADLLAERLLKSSISKADIIRMNAASRQRDQVTSKQVAKVCNYNASGEVFYPSQDELMLKRVVVCTLVTAGRLVSADLTGFFTHIFIDESGHAIEPEALIPITGLLQQTKDGKRGQLVLAGDPKQLGPILRSQVSVEHGLGLSLLERYMLNCELYQKNPATNRYNDDVVTKLVNNYRSHPYILTMPNQLFYDGELTTCADELERNKFCNWSELPKQGFPIIVHGIYGRDQRESDSPSYFNVSETETVVEYISKLSKLNLPKVRGEHIGIISPYRKQIKKIQQLLRARKDMFPVSFDSEQIKVGSVEEFQGQERSIIIISTVRSESKLGFVNSPKRFNVAITRAKSLLIVVGNPVVLAIDDSWRRFIDFCQTNGAVKPRDMFGQIAAVTGGASTSTSTSNPEERDPEWRGER